MVDDAQEKRQEMLEAVSMFDEQMMEDLLEEKEITEEAIHAAIKKGVNSLEFVPVYLGSAFQKSRCAETIGRSKHLLAISTGSFSQCGHRRQRG
jgi:translation elongation factor EF-G